jgi:hypothetical protein
MDKIPNDILFIIQAYIGPHPGLIMANWGLYRALKGLYWAYCINCRHISHRRLYEGLSSNYLAISKAIRGLKLIEGGLMATERILSAWNIHLVPTLAKYGTSLNKDATNIFSYILRECQYIGNYRNLLLELYDQDKVEFVICYIICWRARVQFDDIEAFVYEHMPEYSPCLYYFNEGRPKEKYRAKLFKVMAKYTIFQNNIYYLKWLVQSELDVRSIMKEIKMAFGRAMVNILLANWNHEGQIRNRLANESYLRWLVKLPCLYNRYNIPSDISGELAAILLLIYIHRGNIGQFMACMAKMGPSEFNRNRLYIYCDIIHTVSRPLDNNIFTFTYSKYDTSWDDIFPIIDNYGR